MNMKVTMEVLRIRDKKFCDTYKQCIEFARKMEFIVEQGHDAVL